MSKTPEKPKKYEERLMDALDFDEDDIEANQDGQFSQAQIAHLKAARNAALVQFALMWLFIGVLAAIVVGFGIRAWGALPAVTVGLLAMSAISFLFSKALRLMKDLRDKQILAAEGRVDLSVRNYTDYALFVDKQQFILKQQEVFLSFKNGDPYRIYFTPHTRQILSVEWLRENDDNLIDADEGSADAEIDSAGDSMPDRQTLRRRK